MPLTQESQIKNGSLYNNGSHPDKSNNLFCKLDYETEFVEGKRLIFDNYVFW